MTDSLLTARELADFLVLSPRDHLGQVGTGRDSRLQAPRWRRPIPAERDRGVVSELSSRAGSAASGVAGQQVTTCDDMSHF
jgi:hypothetical protein